MGQPGFNPRWFLGDFDTSVSAAGTTQATATILTGDWSKVSTVGALAGVVLVEAPFPSPKGVMNAAAANELRVYPWSGAAFNGRTVNDPLVLPVGRAALFVCLSSTDIFAIF